MSSRKKKQKQKQKQKRKQKATGELRPKHIYMRTLSIVLLYENSFEKYLFAIQYN